MRSRVNSPENWSDEWNDAPRELLDLFAAYREACAEIEAGPDFLPGIWRQIEGRQSFWFSFEHLARGWAAVAVAICLLLVALNLTSQAPVSSMSYADALAAEHSADRTYYAEGVRTTSADDSFESPSR